MAQKESSFLTKNAQIQDLLKKQTELHKNKTTDTTESPIEDVPVVEIRDRTKEVTSFVGLSGIAISDTGEISKTKFFNLLKPSEEMYSDMVFTEEQAKNISRSMRHLTTGINASVPMICKGLDCPFANSCIYVQENKIPLARPCLIEKQLIEYWTVQYMEEFNVDINNTTEVLMVSELAEFNIYEKRITQHLSEKHQDLLQDFVMGFDANGNELVNKDISKAWELKEKIKSKRMKVLEALMATRKERTKLKIEEKTGNTSSEQIGSIRKRLEELNRAISQIRTVDAEIVGDKK